MRVVHKRVEVVGAEISVREHVEEDDIDGICDGFTVYNDVGDMDPILIRTQEPARPSTTISKSLASATRTGVPTRGHRTYVAPSKFHP